MNEDTWSFELRQEVEGNNGREALTRGNPMADLTARYALMSDVEIVRLAQRGDSDATDYLLEKYRSLVRQKVQRYFIIGAEREDLEQVGMIGLWQAIMDYREDRNVAFKAFARVCIERQIITAVKAATRQKQLPLNNSISLDTPIHPDEDDEQPLWELIPAEEAEDPANIIIYNELLQIVEEQLVNSLSAFERQVLEAYREGKPYREMAAELKCTVKSIDNALSRVKRKLFALTAQLCRP
ncbi:MAG: RNA polymerase sporulation sigma factor SigH [Candidatus Methylomirabilales bacterium]